MKIRIMLVCSMLCAGMAWAQGDVIAERKKTMKGVGEATKAGVQMARGNAPFDLAKSREIFATYERASARMPDLFPETSKTGGDTEARPRIWQEKPAFDARFAKLGTDAKEAAVATRDLPSFQAAFGTVTKNCDGCHEIFRIKKD